MTSVYIVHSGIKGMRWGVRRWQNPDGSLTPAGKQRYGSVENFNAQRQAKKDKIKKAAKIAGEIALGGAAVSAASLAAYKNIPAVKKFVDSAIKRINVSNRTAPPRYAKYNLNMDEIPMNTRPSSAFGVYRQNAVGRSGPRNFNGIFSDRVNGNMDKRTQRWWSERSRRFGSGNSGNGSAGRLLTSVKGSSNTRTPINPYASMSPQDTLYRGYFPGTYAYDPDRNRRRR